MCYLYALRQFGMYYKLVAVSLRLKESFLCPLMCDTTLCRECNGKYSTCDCGRIHTAVSTLVA